MSTQPEQQNRRILVIDDNDAIHLDFKKILGDQADTAVLDELRTSLLGAKPIAPDSIPYKLEGAHQGQEGLDKVRQSLKEGLPYSLAFVDMRMPPGWDGLETIEQIWKVDPQLQVVICTAYSDYSWKEIHQRLGQSDGLLILKKPFDNVEVRQLACALTEKWHLAQQAQLNLNDLESTIQKRTTELHSETTDRRLAQTAQQESEAQTRAILQAAADAIITINDQGIINTFNRAAENMFGYEADEILGHNVKILASSPHRDNDDSYLDLYLRTGQTRIIGLEREVEAVRKDGSKFPMALRVAELQHNNERLFIATIQDITERKRIENKLAAVARLPEANPSPIMRLSHDARVLYANPASKAMLASWNIADEKNLGSWWKKQVSQTLETTEYRDVEYERDGSIFEFRMGPVQELNYVNIWGHDITNRIRAEAQREELHRELQTNTDQLERQKAQLVDEIAQRMVAEYTARHDATHDTLTGLSNRAMLMERIEESIMRSKGGSSYKFALLFLDFDRFKLVNDSLGHEVGDQLLISIAARLKENLRADDLAQTLDESQQERNIPTRLGGDEFVVVLDHISNVNDAIHVADRLQKALEEPHKLGAHEVTSTASIGIVISDSAYNSADEMLRDADTAMYKAKAAGKAQHKVFDKTMHDQATDRLQLENDLRTALQKEQFRILYQPIVELESGQIIGFEALIRWEHPTRGLISPIDFIPVAEETGLIVPIGGWVLLKATQQLKKWQTMFPRKNPLSMNVNISKRQLTQPDLVNTIQNVLRSIDIPAYTLKLEITESAIMSDMEQLTPILHSLRNLGLHLCIDDFGTGQSSLSCLHMFAIDVLKIDRYFLKTMGESREYAAVTHAIVTLAHNLGMDVVAEGVETADQVAQLQALETDHAQGYFFARPIKPEEIEALLQNSSSLAMSAA